MAIDDEIPRSWGLLSLATLAAITLGPPWLCLAQDLAAWPHVAAGAVLWFASVCVKRVVLQVAIPRWLSSRPPVTVAVWQGIISAATELGAAALYLATLSSASLVDIIAFGVGAGSAEAGYVLVLAIVGPKPAPDELAAWVRGAQHSWCVRYSVPIERLFALIGHTGSRGLLYVAMAAGLPIGLLWAAVSVLLFTAIDGVAVFGHHARWRWHDPAVCRRAHSFFALLSVIEFTAFMIGFRLAE